MGAGASATNAEVISNASPDEIKASFEALPSEQQARFLHMMESPNVEQTQAAQEDASAAPEADSSSGAAEAPAMEEAPASVSVPDSGSEVQVGEGEKTSPTVVQEAAQVDDAAPAPEEAQACDAPLTLEEASAPLAVEIAAAIEVPMVAEEKATPPVITEAVPVDESAADEEEKAVAAPVTEEFAVDAAPAADAHVAFVVGEGAATDEVPAVEEPAPALEEVVHHYVKSAPDGYGTKDNELTEEQSANLQKTFDAIDTNKNGAIEASEFKKACELFGLPVSASFLDCQFDVKHGAKIDRAEFTRLIVEAVSQ